MKGKRRSNVCEICRYKCIRRDHLTQHMHVHSDERLFVCPVDGCEVDFKRKDHLIRHVKSKHGARLEGEQPNIRLTSSDSSSVARLAPQAEFSIEVDGPMTRGSEPNRTILELRQEIVRLQEKYAKAESEKQMANSSVMEMRTKLEELKRTECELQDRWEEAKHQLIEGEKLQKKMHNTILDLLK